MVYKIFFSGKVRLYESEKTFLRYYRKFAAERDGLLAKTGCDIGVPRAFVINDNWSPVSVLKGK